MIKHRIAYNPVIDWRFDITRAEGSYLYDHQQKRYIDFTSGWNTANLGWNHPELRDALITQSQKNVYVPMWSTEEMQIAYAKALTDSLPHSLDVVCRTTGGTESNEMALKIARAATGRKKIISFVNSYHGHSFGTLALGYKPAYVKEVAPLVPEFIQIPFPSIVDQIAAATVLSEFEQRLESLLLSEDVAAVVTEPGIITGWGSLEIAPDGFMRSIRNITQKYGTLLIVDEVGSGFSRLGKLYGIEIEGITPDMVTLAKGISNGAMPIGAVVTRESLIADILDGFKPTSSFGWTPLACAVAMKCLEIHMRDRMWEQAERKGRYLQKLLNSRFEDSSIVYAIRGIGMEIGFNLRGENAEDKVNRLAEEAFVRGLHIAKAGDCVQLMPPLTIDESFLDEGVEILAESIEALFIHS